MIKKILPSLYIGLLILILYAPLLIIFVYSFTTSKVIGNWTGFSLELYRSMFSGGITHSLTSALWNTFIIGFSAALISTILGTFAAIGINNMRPGTKKAISTVNLIPVLNPDIITAISLFLLFASIGITQGYLSVVAAHITFCTPYVVLSVLPRLYLMQPNLYEAALDLGARPFEAMYKVLLPELKPGIISGFILAFTLSIDDFVITLFTVGNKGIETLSTYIYADARRGGLTPEIRPLSAVIFITVLVLLTVVNIMTSAKARKKE